MKKIFILFTLLMFLPVFPCHAAYKLDYIYTQNDSNFSYQGQWSAGKVGYQMKECTYANAGNETYAQWSLGVESGKIYTIYLWKTLEDKGSCDAQVEVELTGDKYTVPYSMGRGMIGWTKIGTYSLADGRASVKISGKTGTLILSAIRIVEGDGLEDSENVIYLKTGNKNAYKNSELHSLDVPAKISGDRTFVPARFVSECLGANVAWDEETKTASVTYGADVLMFTKDSAEYTVNGETKKLDVPVFIEDGRTMLPLRTVSDEFKQNVLWDERGIIVICPASYSQTKQDEEMKKAISLYSGE